MREKPEAEHTVKSIHAWWWHAISLFACGVVMTEGMSGSSSGRTGRTGIQSARSSPFGSGRSTRSFGIGGRRFMLSAMTMDLRWRAKRADTDHQHKQAAEACDTACPTYQT